MSVMVWEMSLRAATFARQFLRDKAETDTRALEYELTFVCSLFQNINTRMVTFIPPTIRVYEKTGQNYV